MSRSRSALVEIGGFGLVTSALSVCAAFAVVLTLPEPRSPRMTAADAVAALRGAPEFSKTGLVRRVGNEPLGVRPRLIEAAVANALGATPADVRVVWTTSSEAVVGLPPALTLRVDREQLPHGLDASHSPARIVTSSGDLLPRLLSTEAQAVILQAPHAPFKVGLRRTDGQWWIVETVTPFWSGWRLRLLVACAACLLLLAPLTWLFARRITRPLRQLADRAAAPQPATDALRGPREVRAAAEAIDTMRCRLAEEAAERVRMVAAVAHDLRTPLTSIRLRVERAPSQVRDRVADDIARMEAMIVEVLDFARSDTLVKVCLDLRNLAGERVEQAGGSDRLRLVNGPPMFMNGDPLQLSRVLDNLIQNALSYAGGAEIDVVANGGALVLTVSDDGPGLPPAERERLIAPFVRGEASRNRNTGGAGLGLSIVRDIVERHGGRFDLHANAGGGTVAECRFPRSDE